MNTEKIYQTMFREYDDLLIVSDVEKILNISRHQVYHLINTNQLRAIRPGNSFLVPKMLLINYVMGLSHNADMEKC